MKRKIVLMLLVSLVSPYMMLSSSLAADAPEFLITADKQSLKAGETVTMTLSGKNLKDLYAYEAKFDYDPAKLELQESESKMKGFSVSPIKKDREITVAHTKIGSVEGEKGDVQIGTLTFKAKGAGSSEVKWTAMKVVDHNLKSETYEVNQSVSVSASGTAEPPQLSFTDIKGHWAEEKIMEAVGKGMIEGFPDGTFRPNDSITRAQFSAILARALKLQEEENMAFADLDKIPAWAKSEIAKAVKAGIIQGYEDNTFRSDRNITRSEIAVMVARGLNLEEGDGSGLTFADTGKIPAWAKGYVEAAVEKGVIQGRGNNMFVPGASATRAEATVLVLRMLESK